MRETTPIEHALCLLERFEREIQLMKSQLAAYLPGDDHPAQDFFTDPLTGMRRKIKRRSL